MDYMTSKFVRRRCGGVVLTAILLLTFGCGQSGPGYTAPSTPPAGPTESIKDKRPKDAGDAGDSKTRGGRRGKRPAGVKGLDPGAP